VSAVRSVQGRFCFSVPKSTEAQKPQQVGQVVLVGRSKIVATAKVGLVRFYRGFFGVGVGRAHLHIPTECRIVDKPRGICCFEGVFSTASKWRDGAQNRMFGSALLMPRLRRANQGWGRP